MKLPKKSPARAIQNLSDKQLKNLGKSFDSTLNQATAFHSLAAVSPNPKMKEFGQDFAENYKLAKTLNPVVKKEILKRDKGKAMPDESVSPKPKKTKLGENIGKSVNKKAGQQVGLSSTKAVKQIKKDTDEEKKRKYKQFRNNNPSTPPSVMNKGGKVGKRKTTKSVSGHNRLY